MSNYEKLRARAASGDRKAARLLTLRGYWPDNWDPDDKKNLDHIIEASRREIKQDSDWLKLGLFMTLITLLFIVGWVLDPQIDGGSPQPVTNVQLPTCDQQRRTSNGDF